MDIREKRKKVICDLVKDPLYVPMKEKELAVFLPGKGHCFPGHQADRAQENVNRVNPFNVIALNIVGKIDFPGIGVHKGRPRCGAGFGKFDWRSVKGVFFVNQGAVLRAGRCMI